MRHLIKYMFSLVLTLMAALPMQAQTENKAFYIYQNDGHFDGFFYDEIEKMSFSFLDTLGVEHDEIVSQEIITPDSTYRIMLSAIDSIGFVQPQTIYNKRVCIKDKDTYYTFAVWDHYDDTKWGGEEYIVFSKNLDSGDYFYDEEKGMIPIPQPQVGDIYASFDLEDGFICKITELTREYPGWEGWLVGYCKPIDDISEVFQQFVAVEEYGYADNGTMVRRRVAGHPELNVGKSATRASGNWEGDIFSFSMNSTFPLYDSDKLNVGIITAIDGKLHVKTAWNLPLFGNKYIGIDTRLDFGVAGGFSIDGKISKTFVSGLGDLGSIPVPAACPIFAITIGPDVFLRGEAHVNFAYMPHKANGSFWTKLEINNWIPSFDMGFGTPKGEDNEVSDENRPSKTLSLNGFVQAGLQFPLTFGSLPALKKFFNFSAGSKVYLGPKLGADFTLNLDDFEIDYTMGEIKPVDFINLRKKYYNILLSTTFQLHMLDADFDVKSKMETAFSEDKEFTLFSGSDSLLPPLDMSFVPKFGKCEEFTEDRYIESEFYGNQVLKCRVLAFKPSGLVVKPVKIGARIISRIKDDGTEDFDYTGDYPAYSEDQKYYDVLELIGQKLPKEKWARMFIPYRPGRNYSKLNGKFKVSPVVHLLFDREAIGSEEYEFEHGAILHVNGQSRYEGGNIYTDELYLNADGTLAGEPLQITSNCDSLARYSRLDWWERDDIENLSRDINNELQVVGGDGNFTIEKHPDNYKNSFNPCDTILVYYSPYGGVKTIEGEIFESFMTERRQLYVYKLPNKKAPNTCSISFGGTSFPNAQMTATKLESGRGWHFSVDGKKEDRTLSAEFDITYGFQDEPPGITRQYSPRLRFTKFNVYEKPSDTFSRQYTLRDPEYYINIRKDQEGFIP